jgi:hypothetical protein
VTGQREHEDDGFHVVEFRIRGVLESSPYEWLLLARVLPDELPVLREVFSRNGGKGMTIDGKEAKP